MYKVSLNANGKERVIKVINPASLLHGLYLIAGAGEVISNVTIYKY